MLTRIAGCRCASSPLASLTAPIESALTADQWVLQRGARYRAVFQLNMWDAGDAWNALQDLGFTEIKIYDAQSLPPDWPVSYDDPTKDATPTVDTVIVRAELLWPKSDASVARRMPLSQDTAIVLKAWRWGGTPDPVVPPKPDVPPPPAPDPLPPGPGPDSDPLGGGIVATVAIIGTVLAIGGVALVVFWPGGKS